MSDLAKCTTCAQSRKMLATAVDQWDHFVNKSIKLRDENVILKEKINFLAGSLAKVEKELKDLVNKGLK